MKAQDLRIGNLVYVDNEKYWPKLKGIPLEVTGISENCDVDGLSTHSISLKYINQKKNTYYETYSQFIKFIEPIPLTEDSLLKLDFVNHGYEGLEWSKDGITIIGGNDLGFGVKINVRIDLDFEYVHELQNYYQLCTKKELTFKP